MLKKKSNKKNLCDSCSFRILGYVGCKISLRMRATTDKCIIVLKRKSRQLNNYRKVILHLEMCVSED